MSAPITSVNYSQTNIVTYYKSSKEKPLELYWNGKRFDNFTCATDQGKKDATSAGYHFVRTLGYIIKG